MQRKVRPKACDTSELGEQLARQLAIYACRPHWQCAGRLDNQGSSVNKIKSCSAVWIAVCDRKSFVRSY